MGSSLYGTLPTESTIALMYYQQKRISEANRLANEVLTEKVKVYGFETYEMHRELRRIFEDQLQ